MKRICIESPLSGDFAKNIEYARRCMRYVLDLGHAPFASHLLYTQVLDDRVPDHRGRGLEAGLAMGDSCDERWFFLKDGELSRGMTLAWERACVIEQVRVRLSIGDVTISPTPELRQLSGSQYQRLRELCGNLEDDAAANPPLFDGLWRVLECVLDELDGDKHG